jgi:hypothetical protein
MNGKRLPLFRPFWQDSADDWQDDTERSHADVERLERQIHSLQKLQRKCGMERNLIACMMIEKAIADTRRELAVAHRAMHRAGYVTGRLRRLVGGAR